jgi:hypothetical protein
MEAGTAGRTNLAEKKKKGPPGPCSGRSCSRYSMSRTMWASRHDLYFTVLLLFLAFRFCSAYFIYLVSCKWYQSTFLGRNCGYFFFRVETYSDVFKPQRSVVTRINPRLRDSYTQEIQVVLKRTFVGHPCNPCWYPFEW